MNFLNSLRVTVYSPLCCELRPTIHLCSCPFDTNICRNQFRRRLLLLLLLLLLGFYHLTKIHLLSNIKYPFLKLSYVSVFFQPLVRCDGSVASA